MDPVSSLPLLQKPTSGSCTGTNKSTVYRHTIFHKYFNIILTLGRSSKSFLTQKFGIYLICPTLVCLTHHMLYDLIT